MSRVLELGGSNFDRVLRSASKVFVDFWAPWCKPCIKMNPVIDQLAEKHGSIVFAKVNVDEENEIASRFHISSLPHYVLFKNARPSVSKIGSASVSDLEKLISEQN